jgi:hypothetical protein
MANVAWIALGSVAWIVVPSLCAWVIFYGMRTGWALARGGKYSRKSEPILFWLTLSAYALLLAFWLGISALIGFDILWAR